MTDIFESSKNFNKLRPVGIITTTGADVERDSLWHPSINMIDHHLTALQLSVIECANIGCSSIWICCDETFQPVIRKVVGNFIKDPISIAKSNFTNFPRDNQVDIPIYYYMVHPRDRSKRTGPVWDVLNTCLTIYHISKKISRWVVPEKYYITSCFGVYDVEQMLSMRGTLRKEENISLYFDGKNFLDDLYLPFSVDSKIIKNILYNLKNKTVFSRLTNVKFSDTIDLLDERFENFSISSYYSCSNWKDYKELIGKYKPSKKYDINYLFS